MSKTPVMSKCCRQETQGARQPLVGCEGSSAWQSTDLQALVHGVGRGIRGAEAEAVGADHLALVAAVVV